MNNITKGQDVELNKLATIFANEYSKEKGSFPDGKRFKRPDIIKMIRNIKLVGPTLLSVFKTPKVIRNQKKYSITKELINEHDFNVLDDYISNTLEINAWGVAELDSIDILKDQGIPFRNVIVLSKHMDKNQFIPKNLPNMDCQIEVMKVYGETGIAAIKVTNLLRKLGYAAYPNHSLGGNIDYTKAGMMANLGYIGKNGMLITKENGSCNRISVVYTNIPNLGDHLKNDEDFTWGYEFCKTCNQCVKKCPHDAIYNDNIIDVNGHVESIDVEKCHAGFLEYGCGLCIAVCPFTKMEFNKIKQSYMQRKDR